MQRKSTAYYLLAAILLPAFLCEAEFFDYFPKASKRSIAVDA
jgi:hypothetical protein